MACPYSPPPPQSPAHGAVAAARRPAGIHLGRRHGHLHEQVRTEYWAYDADENLTNDDLIAEAYRGIRPAPGYPACPDHTEKGKLWQLLDVEAAIDLQLTDSYAMFPTAAVSGFYYSHPDAKYFSVGKVSRDQVESFAERKGISIDEAEKWLSPNLGYDPSEADAA